MENPESAIKALGPELSVPAAEPRPPAPAQYAAVAAFAEDSYRECDAAVAEFAATRALLLASADRLGWGPAAPPDGAFYYWADLGPQLGRWGGSAQ